MSDDTLAFRPLAEADLETTRRWRNHPDSLRWFVDKAPVSQEDQRRWFLSRVGIQNDIIFLLCAADHSPVGQFSVYHVELDNARAEVGRFLIDPAQRGRGYFDVGLSRLLQASRARYRLREVYLNVQIDNFRAIRAYERNGFTAVATVGDMQRMRLDLT
jgi:RimJ/RimL family protein N-acetyltransferase